MYRIAAYTDLRLFATVVGGSFSQPNNSFWLFAPKFWETDGDL